MQLIFFPYIVHTVLSGYTWFDSNNDEYATLRSIIIHWSLSSVFDSNLYCLLPHLKKKKFFSRRSYDPSWNSPFIIKLQVLESVWTQIKPNLLYSTFFQWKPPLPLCRLVNSNTHKMRKKFQITLQSPFPVPSVRKFFLKSHSYISLL